MKNYVAVAGLVLSMALVSAASADTSAQWSCNCQGEQNLGGPVGQIWQSVSGQGASEEEATDAALQSCMSQGLQMCSVTGCSQN
jgi:hypothetical protein